VTRELHVAKAHAYGNDFLLVDEREALSPEVVRRLCARHRGVGADGVVLYALRERTATMRLFNADGSS
jgi:diaminopimelate epimerase